MTTTPFSIGYDSGAPLDPVTLAWTGSDRPDWLRTRFLQNGPGLYRIGDQPFHHWFDGLAMLRGFDIGDEIVARSQFLNSPDYVRCQETGRVSYTQFATVPDRNLWQRLKAMLPRYEFGKNAAINFVPRTDGVLAIGDLPSGIEIDPATLDTIGVRQLDQWTMLTSTPHPQRDDRRREWINVGLGLSWKGVGYNVYGLPDGSRKPRPIAFIPRSRPAYMHSVGASENHVVVAEHPMFVGLWDMATLGLRNRPLIDAMAWDPDAPMTLFALNKDDGRVAATVEVPGRLYFHHTNVFESGDEVVIDLCTYANADVVYELYLDKLRAEGNDMSPSVLIRYRINTRSGSVTEEPLCAASIEFPKINPRHEHGAYRYAYAVSYEPGTSMGQANQLIKVDVTTGETVTWYEPGIYPTEPFMVPRPGGTDEDDGVLLSMLLDVNAGCSALAVFDAATLTEIGRANLPTVLPFGFHGQVIPGAG